MQDYGTRQTDLAVNRAEWRLSRVYSQAVREIEEKTKAWEKGHVAREKRYREEVKAGKLSQADFDAWLRGQVFQGQQWQARKAELQRVLYNADQAANKIVNQGKLGVFAQNANYIGYQLDHGGKVNSGFTLYDEHTVARLIKSDPQILPKAAPGVQKDKAYTYYNKLINSAITQGIVQGETISDIARRIAEKTGESAYTSAIRNARTAYTGAQNAGRIEGLHQAQELGINVKKQWMATLDSKTRDTHADLDGQVRDVDEPFEVDGMTIDYPGDPTADPSLVYNCRCTLVYVYPDYPSNMDRRDAETGEKIGDMTYKEWEAWKAEGKPEAPSEELQEPARPENEQPILRQFNVYDPSTRTDAEKLAQINPHLNDSIAYKTNCQRTVVAEEMVYRGYDVEAMPFSRNDPVKNSGIACWEVDIKHWRNDGGFVMAETKGSFIKHIKEAFNEWGDGARAIVRVQWTRAYGGNGHFFTARRIGDNIVYTDPQTNQIRDIKETLSKCTTSRNKLWIMRVDNRKLTDNVKYAVKNRGK